MRVSSFDPTIDAAMSSTLEDLRVLELPGGVAAGYCGKLFAEYGADVIKVEPPSGDPLRRQGPFAADRPQRETGALWLYLLRREIVHGPEEAGAREGEVRHAAA